MKRHTNNLSQLSNNQHSLENQSYHSCSSSSLVPALSKYKFIPPSKILQNKNIQKGLNEIRANRTIQSVPNQKHMPHDIFKRKKNKHHYQSMTEPDVTEVDREQRNDEKKYFMVQEDELASPLKVNRNFNKKREFKLSNNSIYHKCLQNYEQILNKKEQNLCNNSGNSKKMFRSVSNTKIPQDQSIQQIKAKPKQNQNRNTFSNKQNSFTIKAFNSRNNKYQSGEQTDHQQQQIERLAKYIEELKIKEQKDTEQIQNLKNRNQKLMGKLKEFQKQIEKKDELIMQLNEKVSEYELKASEKCHQHSLIIESLKKIILSQKTKINQLEAFNEVIRAQEASTGSWVYNNDSPEKNKFMMTVVGSDYNDTDKMIYNGAIQNAQEASILINHKLITPNFGSGTPDMSKETLNEQIEDLDDCTLLSCERGENTRLQELSRIEESAQCLEQSSIMKDDNKNYDDLDEKEEQSSHPLEHQQLLHEIDQYLEKWNKKR